MNHNIVSILSVFVLSGFTSSAAYAQLWPPDMEMNPIAPVCNAPIELTVFGLWPNACIPDGSGVFVNGDTINFDLYLPPGIVCAQVIVGYAQSQTLDCVLAPGTYTVVATSYSSMNQVVSGPSVIGELVVELSPSDTNGDCRVNVTDLLLLLGAWGSCPAPCPPDINNDGNVNVTDLLTLLAGWGACP